MDRGASIRSERCQKITSGQRASNSLFEMPLFTSVRAAQAVPDQDQNRSQKGMRIPGGIRFRHDLGLRQAANRPFRSAILPKWRIGLGTLFR